MPVARRAVCARRGSSAARRATRNQFASVRPAAGSAGTISLRDGPSPERLAFCHVAANDGALSASGPPWRPGRGIEGRKIAVHGRRRERSPLRSRAANQRPVHSQVQIECADGVPSGHVDMQCGQISQIRERTIDAELESGLKRRGQGHRQLAPGSAAPHAGAASKRSRSGDRERGRLLGRIWRQPPRASSALRSISIVSFERTSQHPLRALWP